MNVCPKMVERKELLLQEQNIGKTNESSQFCSKTETIKMCGQDLFQRCNKIQPLKYWMECVFLNVYCIISNTDYKLVLRSISDCYLFQLFPNHSGHWNSASIEHNNTRVNCTLMSGFLLDTQEFTLVLFLRFYLVHSISNIN